MNICTRKCNEERRLFLLQGLADAFLQLQTVFRAGFLLLCEQSVIGLIYQTKQDVAEKPMAFCPSGISGSINNLVPIFFHKRTMPSNLEKRGVFAWLGLSNNSISKVTGRYGNRLVTGAIFIAPNQQSSYPTQALSYFIFFSVSWHFNQGKVTVVLRKVLPRALIKAGRINLFTVWWTLSLIKHWNN